MIKEYFNGFQGEGAFQGRRCLFIRFAGCNLSCKICDSKYTWDINKQKDFNEMDVFDFMLEAKPSHIVFSGGEPLLHENQNSITRMISGSDFPIKQVEIETNGTQLLSKAFLKDSLNYLETSVLFNICPKVFIPQKNEQIKIYPLLLKQLQNLHPKDTRSKRYSNFDYTVKLLFEDFIDLCVIQRFIENNAIPKEKVYLQPIGTTKNIKNIICRYYCEILSMGYNLSSRLHILLFGNIRGV